MLGEWQSPLLRRRVEAGAKFQNVALSHAASILRSEQARVDGQLNEDFAAVMRGNAVYIHNFVCTENDNSLYHSLKKELVESTGATMDGDGGLIEWSKHQVFENPTDISETFNQIIEMLAEYFDVDVYATRLNYYRDGSQWKPQHHDSHAYGGRAQREDFTVGITLGAERSLLFIHEASKREFNFPQKNGDCFAFTGEVNKTFTHGVPRVHAPIGDRFSIIAWGRRKSLNPRNGGGRSAVDDEAMLQYNNGNAIETMEDAVQAAKAMVSNAPTSGKAQAPSSGGGAQTNAPLSNRTSANGCATTAAKKKKNRLQ